MGLTLTIEGVPFQQQDQAVGACATTALWCAIAATTRRDGGRAPTPLAITTAAHRMIPTSRALPAHGGMTLEQMVAAVNAAGHDPDHFKFDAADNLFEIQLLTYVRSGFVVLLHVDLQNGNGHHAIAVVGFREAQPSEQRAKLAHREIEVPAAAEYYVHDDRLGPYARAEWEQKDDNLPTLTYVRQNRKLRDFAGITGPMEISSALVALYPKIRVNAQDLLRVAGCMAPLVRMMDARSSKKSVLRTFFALSGSYLEGIYDRVEDSARAVQIIRTLTLPRYVGVLRYSTGDRWALDVLIDTTDIFRESSHWESVLAVLPGDPRLVQDLREGLTRLNSKLSVL